MGAIYKNGEVFWVVDGVLWSAQSFLKVLVINFRNKKGDQLAAFSIFYNLKINAPQPIS
jgi:hypothetical protein